MSQPGMELPDEVIAAANHDVAPSEVLYAGSMAYRATTVASVHGGLHGDHSEYRNTGVSEYRPSTLYTVHTHDDVYETDNPIIH